MNDQAITELELLRSELESDISLCQSRSEHIRLALRLTRVDGVLEELKSIQLTS